MRDPPVTQPDPTRQEKAREYAKTTRHLFFIEVGLAGALLLVLVFGGISIKLSQYLAVSQPWAAAIYFLILTFGYGILTSPLSYYQGLALPRHYGLSVQTLKDWLKDMAKTSILSLSLGTGLVILVYWLLGRLPDWWWLTASGVAFVLSLLLTWLTPNLLLPLFFKLRTLEDNELKQKLINLAERAQTKVHDVLTMDLSTKSTTANAMLAGLGNTKRIILSDTLLNQYSPAEVEVVLAHELSHHIHRDIPKLVVTQGVTFVLIFLGTHLALKASLGYFTFRGMDDVATLPFLLLVLAIAGLILTPIANILSRHLESAADEKALELTGNPQAFITTMTKLTDQNLDEAQPSRWVELLFYDHPPYTKRVALARHYSTKNSVR